MNLFLLYGMVGRIIWTRRKLEKYVFNLSGGVFINIIF